MQMAWSRINVGGPGSNNAGNSDPDFLARRHVALITLLVDPLELGCDGVIEHDGTTCLITDATTI